MAEKLPKFITYEHSSGEIIFIRRDAITSFHPKLNTSLRGVYDVFVTVGKETYPIYRATSMADAKSWILEQIALMES